MLAARPKQEQPTKIQVALDEMTLHPYQNRAIEKVFDFFSTRNTGKLCLVSPTGTGKSVIKLSILKHIHEMSPDAIVHVITPKINIIRGYLKILGYQGIADMSHTKLKRLGMKHGVFTYGTYRNKLVKGLLDTPNVLLIDEAHHMKLGNIQTDQILYDAQDMKVIGFTATPYRGTPKKTRDFRAEWDEFYEVISIRDAIVGGFWRMPEILLEGLIDDDILTVSNGKFVIRSLGDIDKAAKGNFFEAITENIKKYMHLGAQIVEVPNVETCTSFTSYLKAVGIKANSLTHKSTVKERTKAIKELEEATHVLVQVSIVSEGFDLPDLAVFHDAKPKLSPVDFMQTLGRITRKSDIERKIYITYCRNIEHHGHLLDGVIPTSKVIEAQHLFEMPTGRSKQRVFGSERLGRLKELPFYTESGCIGSFYLINDRKLKRNLKTNYAIILLPHKKDPIVVTRKDTPTANPERPWDWGNWKLTTLPEGFEGYRTAQAAASKMPSDAQQKAWDRDAHKYGLDQDKAVTARAMQIFFILRDLKLKLP